MKRHAAQAFVHHACPFQLNGAFLGMPLRPGLLGLCLVSAALRLVSADTSSGAESRPPLKLAPVYRVKLASGHERLITEQQADSQSLPPRPDDVAFWAVAADEWPPGLVPIFEFEKAGRFELRRRPPTGQENFTTPLFFALPSADEPDAEKIAGRWECSALHVGGKKSFPAFELTIEGGQLAGRFDQNSEYRFGFFAGGAFRSNQIELTITYVMDRYTMTGTWHNRTLSGTWRHTEDADHGTWEATRPASMPKFDPSFKTLPLYQWQNAENDGKHYLAGTNEVKSGWKKTPAPLGSVWWKPGQR